MAPLMTVTTTFFALSAAVAAPVPGTKGASAKGERGLRGRRTAEVKYCNSIGCPNGFTPISKAWEVQCYDDECKVDQCCEAFCSYHPCPNNYVPVEDASTIKCDHNTCTTEQCCDYGSSQDGHYKHGDGKPMNHGKKYCNSIGCPNGFTPIAYAWEVECEGDECKVDQCCEAFCSYHPCPNNYVPVKDASTIKCDHNTCTTKQCCDYGSTQNGDPGHDNGKHGMEYCNSIGCPDGLTPIPKAWEVQCHNGECKAEQCCEALCSGFACPNNYVPVKDAYKITCDDNTCTTKQCCDAFCSGYACPNNYIPVKDAYKIKCDYNTCTTNQCCDYGSNNREEDDDYSYNHGWK